ncbi:MAG: hypothetical protein HY735_17265 [Verrucomicrobia bacterium]|nr:hypothetical protein [Verrucomicrobiota bacterium]
MNKNLKLGLYVVLTISSCLFGYLAYVHYNRLMGGVIENAQLAQTDIPALESRGDALVTRGYANVMIFGAVFFVSVVALGFLLGHDVAHYLGDRVLKGVHNDEGEGMTDPDYEAAEQVWADGKYLDAIQLMRDYLKRNPREQHVALRIAEIYEKDLSNNLAAALEYEEVLKQKLPAERWGWTAIHLCNLYFRMNQADKAVVLLRRIDAEYGETAAAEKARKRLALYEVEGGQGGAAHAPSPQILEEPGSKDQERAS